MPIRQWKLEMGRCGGSLVATSRVRIRHLTQCPGALQDHCVILYISQDRGGDIHFTPEDKKKKLELVWKINIILPRGEKLLSPKDGSPGLRQHS